MYTHTYIHTYINLLKVTSRRKRGSKMVSKQKCQRKVSLRELKGKKTLPGL